MGRVSDGLDRGMLFHIYVHGTSGALVYYEAGGMWPGRIRVSVLNIHDIVRDGFRPEWEKFSLTLDEDQFCVHILRHHLKHSIGKAHWLDNRKPENILVRRPGKACWDIARENDLFVAEWKREKQEEKAKGFQ